MKHNATIGVVAPSSGVPTDLHHLLHTAQHNMEKKGFQVQIGETAWTQNLAKSAPAEKRVQELEGMLTDPGIDLIIPPWGGELLIDILERIDFEKIEPKWILGYSDTSLLLLAITLKTGTATAHGTNLIDMRGESWDETTAKWINVLSTAQGEWIEQVSSTHYQKEWQFENPTPHIFHLDEPTIWKTTEKDLVKIEGRLLGGCIDVLHHLVGTPYGDVKKFRETHAQNEPLLWYFENCELITTSLRRSLMQMKLAGWFEGCAGILFGRSDANAPVQNYTIEVLYKELADELQIPIIYDIDCGHVPPQMTLINGAYAEVEYNNGKGKIRQHFR
nr:S66 peptidase family protein [Polycladospora coralii]